MLTQPSWKIYSIAWINFDCFTIDESNQVKNFPRNYAMSGLLFKIFSWDEVGKLYIRWKHQMTYWSEKLNYLLIIQMFLFFVLVAPKIFRRCLHFLTHFYVQRKSIMFRLLFIAGEIKWNSVSGEACVNWPIKKYKQINKCKQRSFMLHL